jgi:hypothetical protein
MDGNIFFWLLMGWIVLCAIANLASGVYDVLMSNHAEAFVELSASLIIFFLFIMAVVV